MQYIGKEREDSYREMKRSPDESHTQTLMICFCDHICLSPSLMFILLKQLFNIHIFHLIKPYRPCSKPNETQKFYLKSTKTILKLFVHYLVTRLLTFLILKLALYLLVFRPPIMIVIKTAHEQTVKIVPHDAIFTMLK